MALKKDFPLTCCGKLSCQFCKAVSFTWMFHVERRKRLSVRAGHFPNVAPGSPSAEIQPGLLRKYFDFTLRLYPHLWLAYGSASIWSRSYCPILQFVLLCSGNLNSLCFPVILNKELSRAVQPCLTGYLAASLVRLCWKFPSLSCSLAIRCWPPYFSLTIMSYFCDLSFWEYQSYALEEDAMLLFGRHLYSVVFPDD